MNNNDERDYNEERWQGEELQREYEAALAEEAAERLDVRCCRDTRKPDPSR